MSWTKIARGLGWFSVALGLAELIAPDTLGRFLGTRRAGLLRTYGLRELAAGIGLLSTEKLNALRPFLWSRVAGDAVDLASLGVAGVRGDQRRNVVLATLAVLGVTGLDVLAGLKVGENMQRL